jgi:hypothetical protein
MESSASRPGRFIFGEIAPQEAGWAPEPVRTFRRIQNSLDHAWNRTTQPLSPRTFLVTVLTELPRLCNLGSHKYEAKRADALAGVLSDSSVYGIRGLSGQSFRGLSLGLPQGSPICGHVVHVHNNQRVTQQHFQGQRLSTKFSYFILQVQNKEGTEQYCYILLNDISSSL